MKFKVGDEIVCTNNGFEGNCFPVVKELDLNKKYKIVELPYEDCVRVINNLGNKKGYKSGRFSLKFNKELF
jgi:hypothetical protein